MSKPAKGTKRVCPSCGARFYDLSRSPIICPACQSVYQVTPPSSRRGERAAAQQEARPAPIEVVAPPKKVPEIVSLDEADEVVEGVVIEDEEEIADLGDDEAVIPAAGDEDAFLEEPEGDEGPDVSGIVSPGKGEEG